MSCFCSDNPKDKVSPVRNYVPKDLRKVKHFFVLVHGNNGFPQQMYPCRDSLVAKFGQECVILVSVCNSRDTFRGVEVGGKRLAEEIGQFIHNSPSEFPKLVKFGMVSHSLGGLYARCALKHVKDDFPAVWKRFDFGTFLTCNSPHLGAKKPAKGFKGFVVSVGADIYSDVIGTTGDDLFLRSDELDVLSDPNGDYLPLLLNFKYRILVGVVCGDFVVPLVTACIRHDNPFPRPKTLLEFMKIKEPPCEVLGYSGFPKSYDSFFQKAPFPTKGEVHSNYQSVSAETESKVQIQTQVILSSEDENGETITKQEVTNSVTEISVYDTDEYNEIEFKRNTLLNLQSINWSRIAVQFHVPHRRFVLNGSLHGMTLDIDGKMSNLPGMKLNVNENGGPVFLNFLTDLLRKNHSSSE